MQTNRLALIWNGAFVKYSKLFKILYDSLETFAQTNQDYISWNQHREFINEIPTEFCWIKFQSRKLIHWVECLEVGREVNQSKHPLDFNLNKLSSGWIFFFLHKSKPQEHKTFLIRVHPAYELCFATERFRVSDTTLSFAFDCRGEKFRVNFIYFGGFHWIGILFLPQAGWLS